MDADDIVVLDLEFEGIGAGAGVEVGTWRGPWRGPCIDEEAVVDELAGWEATRGFMFEGSTRGIVFILTERSFWDKLGWVGLACIGLVCTDFVWVFVPVLVPKCALSDWGLGRGLGRGLDPDFCEAGLGEDCKLGNCNDWSCGLRVV